MARNGIVRTHHRPDLNKTLRRMTTIATEELNRCINWCLEAAAVFFFLFGGVILPVVSVYLFIVFTFSPLWIFSLAYVIWILYDFHTPERGSRPTLHARKWRYYEHIANYFPITLHKTADLSPEHNYIIGTCRAHPHGILVFGTSISICTDATGFDRLFPGIRATAATLRWLFWFPVRRELMLWMSELISVSRESILNYLNESERGRAVAIVVGGAEELLNSHPNTHRVCIANRKGFVRLAIQSGAHLVPMYNFGENDYYHQIPNDPGSLVRRIQNAVKRVISYGPTLVLGRGIFNRFFGLMPFRTPIHSVVGKPIEVHKNPNPSQEEVDGLHARYCAQLSELFEENKLKYGVSRSVRLQLV